MKVYEAYSCIERFTSFKGTYEPLLVCHGWMRSGCVVSEAICVRQILEVVAETEAPQLSLEELLAEQPSEATQADRVAAAQAAEAAAAALQAAREAVSPQPPCPTTRVMNLLCMQPRSIYVTHIQTQRFVGGNFKNPLHWLRCTNGTDTGGMPGGFYVAL